MQQPLNGEEQVCVIYAGVKGYLDKVQTSEIGKFETLFLDYMRTNHKNVLEEIKATGKLSPEADKAIGQAIDTFLPTSGIKLKA